MQFPATATDLLDVRQVARRLAISPRTVKRWVKEGRLPPPIRLSFTCVRWKSSDIEEYVKNLSS